MDFYVSKKDTRKGFTEMSDVLANKIEHLVKEFVVFENEQEATAVTLWIIGTYLMDVWQLWPKLYIYSPEKECGKTRLLSVVEALSKDGRMASNISLSVTSFIFSCSSVIY